MTLYIKKVLPVHAKQWFKDGDQPLGCKINCHGNCWFIPTREGQMILVPGCWIVGPGVEGEYWCVQESIFDKTYVLYASHDEEDPNLCKCGKNYLALDDHTCPYAEEINDDHEFLCNCCPDCRQQCCDDI